MRIAILTQPLRTNYGGILQNYALQQCLKGLGHEAYTLDEELADCPPLAKLAKRFVKVLLGKVPASHLFYEQRYKRDYQVFTKYTRKFVSEHIHLFSYKNIYQDLSSKSFDAYIVGSDQVWRPGYNDIETMFFDFAEGWKVKRLSYAASFGVDTWEFTQEQEKRCAALAASFDGVSVREQSGVALCKKHLGVEAKHVLDPSMLLTKEQYTELVDKNKTKASKGQMFVHVLDKMPRKQDIICDLAKKYGVPPFSCNQSEAEDLLDIPIEKRIQPPVEQWLRSFVEAEYVVTDSFHAAAFSILFNKKFLVLCNSERGLTRIQSLLKLFGLEKCLVTESGDLSFPDIDYQTVNRKVDLLREEARTFLSSHLA